MKAWIGIVIVLLAASTAWGQTAGGPESQPATQLARSLKFEVLPASEAIAWKGERSPEQIIRPTCAAVVSLVPHSHYSEDSTGFWIDRFGPALPGISAQQRAFIRQRVYVTASTYEGSYRLPGGARTTYEVITFFAVSERDARQMAALYVQHRDEQAQQRLDERRQRLAESLKLLEEAPPRIEECAAQYKQVAEQMAARYKSLGVEGDDWEKWTRIVEEGKANLRVLDIERAAQLARLRKIQEYMAQQTQPVTPRRAGQAAATQPNPAVLASLETMLVELNVEMVGTQARRELLEQDIAPWQELRELYRKRRAAEDAKQKWQTKLDDARRALEQLPNMLADPPVDMLPVHVKDDTIRIVPVRAGPTSQASE
jgi:hypothetical protein